MKQPILKDWRFILEDVPQAFEENFDDSSWRLLDVPHDWQIEQKRDPDAGGNQGSYPREAIGWYRKKVFIEEEKKGNAFTLCFDALMQYSKVWFNGQYLGERPYGYIPVRYEVTDLVKFGEENTIAIRLDTTAGGDRWYSGAGIIREAFLYDQPMMRIVPDGLHVMPTVKDDGSADISIEVSWKNGYKKAFDGAVSLSVYAPLRRGRGMNKIWEGDIAICAKSGESGRSSISFNIDKPVMWDVESPRLYDVYATLDNYDYDARFGIRTIRFDKDEGFFLNGRNFKMVGADVHHDGGDAFGACCPKELWVRKLKALKRCGCNTIRMSHNPHDPVLYDLLDEMGFLCVDEYIDKWGRNDWSYQSNFFDEWHERDIIDWINRDYNHPSIVIWSVGNEVEFQYQDDIFYETAEELATIVRRLDTSRAVSMALIGFNLPGFNDHTPMEKKMAAVVRLSKFLDVIMVNYCESFYESMHNAGLEAPILGSEVFMIYRSSEGQFRQNIRKSPLTEDVFEKPYVCGALIWTGVDYLGECGWPNKYWPGAFIDVAGFEKPRANYIKAAWGKEPIVYGAFYDEADPWDRARNRWGFPQIRRHWNYKDIDRYMDMCVMTNCEKVALYLNDDVVRWDSPKDHMDGMAHFVIPYLPGKVELFGYDKNGLAVAHDIIRTSEKKLSVLIRPEKRTYAVGELALIETWLVDEFGNPWVIDRPWLKVEVEGAGELRALTNANFEDDGATKDTCTFIDGHALICVKANEVGKVKIKVSVEDIGEVSAYVNVKEPVIVKVGPGREAFQNPED